MGETFETVQRGFMKMKKVSIVLPTYNRAKVLTRAMDSVLAQTYQDWEL
ncbi:MAG: glycosyltransferase, partial [Lachnospiraceae bacterium]|nr:glycosyltransferase [Lachnospiraceae bacterium]